MNASNNIMVITRELPNPYSGNGRRMLNLISYVKSLGYEIVLVVDQEESDKYILKYYTERIGKLCFIKKRHHSIVRMMLKFMLFRQYYLLSILGIFPPRSGMRLLKKRIISIELISQTKNFCRQYNPKVVICEYIFTSPCLKYVPKNILKVIDTLDLFSKESEKVGKYGITQYYPCSVSEEAYFLSLADVVIAIQPEEAKEIRKMLPGKKVITVGVDFAPILSAKRSIGRKVILFVGTSHHRNVRGFKDFLKYSWPQIKSKDKQVKLRVVGSIARDLFYYNDFDRIEAVDWVSSLAVEYDNATVVINPVYAGTGLKIKSVEALSYGKALVSWPTGVEGMPDHDNLPVLVAESWQQFSNNVCLLLKERSIRKKLESGAIRYSNNHFNRRVVYREMSEVLGNISKG